MKDGLGLLLLLLGASKAKGSSPMRPWTPFTLPFMHEHQSVSPVPMHPEPVIVPHPFPTMTSTAVPFRTAWPPGVPSFPGPAWTPYTPVPGSVAARAGMLLHTMSMNDTKVESGPYGGPVAYHMQPLHADGSGKMVTAWRLKSLSAPLTT